jgi:hypothetical protein
MVVAVPASFVVQGDDKEIVAFEVFQYLLARDGRSGELRSGGVVIPLALLLRCTPA